MKTTPFFIHIVIFILCPLSSFSQEKACYLDFSQKDFRNEKVFNDTLDFEDIDLPRLNALLFYLTNEIRLKHKLPVLEYAGELAAAASMHSRDMVIYDFFNHINQHDPGKRTPDDRAAKAGIANPHIAENIAEDFGLHYKSGTNVYVLDKGQFSYGTEGRLIPARTYLSLGESLLERWMKSPEHRKNILSPDALCLGCGTYYFTDTQFNNMPTFMATQNFQWYEKIKRLQK